MKIFNCLYARPGYCVVGRDMTCFEDCSYYCQKEQEYLDLNEEEEQEEEETKKKEKPVIILKLIEVLRKIDLNFDLNSDNRKFAINELQNFFKDKTDKDILDKIILFKNLAEIYDLLLLTSHHFDEKNEAKRLVSFLKVDKHFSIKGD